MILANTNKYSISAMCKFLKISRSLVYYTAVVRKTEIAITNAVRTIFEESRNHYGSRKIKVELEKLGYQVSRRRIRRIMKENGLVSTYTVKQYKVTRSTCNNDKVENIVNREFDRDTALEVVVSDLTYVKVNHKWNYICLLLDLYNREIIGYAVGDKKDAALVYKAFSSVKGTLENIQIFHTDRGNEFKNKVIEELLETFKIKRSLSAKGCPYDNAVAEATYKIIKTEFAFDKEFRNIEELELKLYDYVNWYNTIRIHGALGYQTPIAYKQQTL